MSEEICYICNNKRKITKHHLFPVRYLKYLPSYWEIQNNKITLCKVCHRYFEQRVLSWYEQLEDSIKNNQSQCLLKKEKNDYKIIAVFKDNYEAQNFIKSFEAKQKRINKESNKLR